MEEWSMGYERGQCIHALETDWTLTQNVSAVEGPMGSRLSRKQE